MGSRAPSTTASVLHFGSYPQAGVTDPLLPKRSPRYSPDFANPRYSTGLLSRVVASSVVETVVPPVGQIGPGVR